jgi:hypothetical protein
MLCENAAEQSRIEDKIRYWPCAQKVMQIKVAAVRNRLGKKESMRRQKFVSRCGELGSKTSNGTDGSSNNAASNGPYMSPEARSVYSEAAWKSNRHAQQH